MKLIYTSLVFLFVHSLAFSQTASYEWEDPTCTDPYNGSLTITVTDYPGDTIQYTLIKTGGSVVTDVIVADSTYTFNNLESNSYISYVNPIDSIDINIKNVDDRELTTIPYYAETFSVKGAGCEGQAVGIAEVSVTGGVGSYSYSWKQEDGTSVFSDTNYVEDVGVGKYYVSVTDEIGCQILSDTVPIDTTYVEVSANIQHNVLCKGESTGEVSATAINGTGEYVYEWSDGHVGDVNDHLPAGEHTVVAIDKISCTDTTSFTITEPDVKIEVSLDSSENLLCKGIPTGKAYLSTINRVGSLDYQWSDEGSGESREALSADEYKVRVFDENMCNDSIQFEITEPETYIQGSVDEYSMPLCYGDTNGTAKISATGGTPGYTYKWNDPDNDSTYNNSSRADLQSMEYVIEFIDAHGCVDSVIFDLDQPDSLVAEIRAEDGSPAPDAVACFGDENIDLRVEVSGGTSHVQSYEWDNPDLVDLPEQTVGKGSYFVTVTDANNCIATSSHTITEPPLLEDSLFTLTPIECNGETGRIGTTTKGGTAPYAYEWSNGATEWNTGQVFSGEYSLTVTDANNCINEETYELTEPDTIVVSLFIEADVCNDVTKGKLWVEAEGGTVADDYSYKWNTGETNDTIENLVPEIYSVTVTDDNGCSVVGEIDLRNVNDFTVDFEKSDVLCPNQSNGEATAMAVNGSAPYTYEWDNGHVGETIADVSEGTYSVTITDVNGCEAFGDVTIETLPTMYFQDYGTTPTPCNKNLGSAYVEVVSGGAPYTYEWSNGETTDSIGNLAVDFYSVVVKDTNGCAISKNFEVTDTSSLIVAAESDNVKIRCAGRADGSAIAYASEGGGDYTYEWSNGATTQEVDNLSEGLYFVYARDANNCTAIDSIRFVEENVLRAFIADSSMITCNGADNGWAIAKAEGGVGPYYQVEWDNGDITTNLNSGLAPGVYTATMTDVQECQVTTQVTITEPPKLSSTIDNTTSVSCGGKCDAQARILADGGTKPYSYEWSSSETDSAATNLCVGWQYVEVRDANGCTLIDSVDIVDTIPRLGLSASMVEPDCNVPNGKIDVSPFGGFAPYTYKWGNDETSHIIEDVLPDVYELTIIDDNGCSLDTMLVLNDNSDLSIDEVQRRAITFCTPCNESYRVISSGGQQPYSFSWSNGDTLHYADSLCSGQYSVTVTDDNECKRSTVIDVEEKPIEVHLENKEDIVCYGDSTGTLEVKASNGVSNNYSYQWSNGDSTSFITDLKAGDYTVTVTEDSSVCDVQKTFTVEQNPELERFFITDMPSYCKDSTGEMHVEVLNGVELTFEWEDGTMGPSIDSVYPEYIGITITDGHGCVVKDSAKVDDVSDFSLYESKRELISCIGDSDGALEVGTNNGYKPFTYSWEHDAELDTLRAESLSQGVYTVYVEDSRGCEVSYTFDTLRNPKPMTFNFKETRPIYCHGGTGDLTAYVSGGHPGYDFNWYMNGEKLSNSSLHLDSISTGLLSVRVTDSRECVSDSVTYNFEEPTPIVAEFTVQQTGCASQSETGKIIVDSVYGHNPPYKFKWHNSDEYTFYEENPSNIIRDELAAGEYVFRVEDSLGICFKEFTNYTHPVVIDTISTEVSHTHCNYYTDEQLLTNDPNGDLELVEIVTKKGNYNLSDNYTTRVDFSDYTIEWSDADSQDTPLAQSLVAGEYTITLTHTNGCSQTFTAGTVDAFVSLTNKISQVEEGIFDEASVCLGDSLRLETHTGMSYTHDYTAESDEIEYIWNTEEANVASRLTHKSGSKVWANPLSTYYNDSSVVTSQYIYDGCYSPEAEFMIKQYDSLNLALEVVDVFDNYVGEDSVFAIKNEYILINPEPTPWYVYQDPLDDGFVSVAWSSLNENKDAQGHLSDTVTNEAAYDISGYYGLRIRAQEPTYYYATATTRNGCVEKAHVAVNVYENMFIPNLITPNGDGNNETWEIPYLHMCPDATVTIHNRWGVKVYENDGPYYENPWDGRNNDGKLLPMNAYYYLIEFNDAYNTSPKSGVVSILY
ncbi:MAG: gliding motility-associated C-terminal domain-containing protein [Bacteroidales bacterium]